MIPQLNSLGLWYFWFGYATMQNVFRDGMMDKSDGRWDGTFPAAMRVGWRRSVQLLGIMALLWGLAGLSWTQPPEETPAESPETAAPTPREVQQATEFVAAADLAAQLKKLDPSAVVEWDGRRLRVQANQQRFTLFLVTSEMVVNGSAEKVSSPLRVYRNEIYIPQDAVDRIAQALAQGVRPSEPGPTTAPLATATPSASPSPALSPTPEPSPALSPTPEPSPTPTPVPRLTPPPSPTPMTTPVESPRASPPMISSPPPPPSHVASPSPSRAASPTRRPPAVVLSTRAPSRSTPPGAKTLALARPSASLSTFERLLQERDEIQQAQLGVFSRNELEAAARKNTVQKILLDPDEGSAGESSTERRRQSSLTLDLARKIQARLALRGYEVELTREDPQPVSLAQKLDRITKAKADVLVSIRIGTNPSAEVSGVRVLYPSPTTDYAVGRPETNLSADSVAVERLYVPFAEKSRTLASLCATALQAESKGGEVSVLPAPIYLLRRAPMPSVLIIAGYLTNANDRARLLDEARQDRMAELMSEAIARYATGGGGPESKGRVPAVKGGTP